MIAHHRELVDRSMSTSMTPYRQAGEIEVQEKISVKRTGLIPFVPPPPPHKCSFPRTHNEIVVEKRKILFFFTLTKKRKEERKVLEGSLYRCPDCYKVYLFEKRNERPYTYADAEWHSGKKANDLWLEKTGEYVDGES